MPLITIPPATPFQMQLAVLEAHMQFERPWTLLPTSSATPVTSLRGALGRTAEDLSHLGDLSEWLRKTPSRHHPGQILPAITLQIDRTNDARVHILRVIVRGARAHDKLDIFYDALIHTGNRGLMHVGERERFRIVEERSSLTSTAHWVIQRIPSTSVPETIIVKLTSPCHAPSLDPRDLVGNMVCSLVKLEHTLQSDPLATKISIDDDADAARNAAREAFTDVVEINRHLFPGPKGQRASGETGHRIPLRGICGSILLGGNLRDALPWLALAELHGLGQHTAFGMGQVRLSWSREPRDMPSTQPS